MERRQRAVALFDGPTLSITTFGLAGVAFLRGDLYRLSAQTFEIRSETLRHAHAELKEVSRRSVPAS
jgi:hypothetical protein